MSNKAIRIQVDILYKVPEDAAQEVYDTDMGFFYNVKEQFAKWGESDDDPRIPITFDLRHDMGSVLEISGEAEEE